MNRMTKIMEGLYSALRHFDIDTVFHLPGSALVPLYAGLDEFGPVLMKHPAAVGFAADAFSRLTGLGIAFVAQGPGLAGIIPAIIHSWKDHIALVVITAKPQYMEGNPGAWQAFPIKSVLSPVVKEIVEISEQDSAIDAFYQAFDLAAKPPCGPVVINIIEGSYKDANFTGTFSGPISKNFSGRSPPSSLPPISKSFSDRILKVLLESSRPLIIAGAGTIRDAKALRNLVHELHVPVVTTAPARGVVDERDQLCLGPVGTIGFERANKALCQAETILALGSRLSGSTIQPLVSSDKFTAQKPVVFQIAGQVQDRSFLVEQENFTVCAVSSAIKGLLDSRPMPLAPWVERTIHRSSNASLPKDSILTDVLNAVDEDSILVMDAGTMGLSTYRGFVARKPNHLLYQWGIATMGSSLASAIGAACTGARRVFVITGDGGFLASLSEMATISDMRPPLKIIVFNNGGHHFIRELQQRQIGKEVGTSFGPVDVASVARSFGLKAERALEEFGLSTEILEALCDSETFLLEIVEKGKTMDLKGTQWDKGESAG
jgi:acetolactate synthase-1/2/3 large subunit